MGTKRRWGFFFSFHGCCNCKVLTIFFYSQCCGCIPWCRAISDTQTKIRPSLLAVVPTGCPPSLSKKASGVCTASMPPTAVKIFMEKTPIFLDPSDGAKAKPEDGTFSRSMEDPVSVLDVSFLFINLSQLNICLSTHLFRFPHSSIRLSAHLFRFLHSLIHSFHPPSPPFREKGRMYVIRYGPR